jgi:hypothetical protein
MGLTRLRLVIYSVRLQEAVGRSHATELQNRRGLGNLRPESDKLKNKQPSPPFVQCLHPQLGADTNGQKSEHLRPGLRFLQGYRGPDPSEKARFGRRRIRINLPHPDTAAHGWEEAQVI